MDALPLYCSDAVRQLDAGAIARGTCADVLMERAGQAAFAWLVRRWPQARSVLVCCGPGNNGGDGYVLARLAALAGHRVQVVALPLAGNASPAARAKHSAWVALGAVQPFAACSPLPAADVVVDAVFGIGLGRAPAGAAAALLAAINAHPAPVMALDVPSGLDADRGAAPGIAVEADCTCSFVAAKRGLYTGMGRSLAGEVRVERLGIEARVDDPPADAHLLHGDLIAQQLRPRSDHAHKGMFGHVLAVGGDVGMGGAIRLCAEAAARTGAGLISVCTRHEHVVQLLAARPECMAMADSAGEVDAVLLTRASQLAVGPGLGRGSWGRGLFRQLRDSGKPAVLDADALFHLADEGQPWIDAVLTPHPAEAARLLGCATAEVQDDRFAAARSLATRFSAIVVLKGNGTLVADPSGRVAVVGAGNPGLATGGSGDVLTGVIASLRAQGLQAFDAACVGALLHARAGDLAAAQGQRGLLASDLFPPLRQLVNP